ncbi:MAG TPA: trigger factor [Gemmatimonadales bacterium]|nr:trigger factor [Gemmatimonadales bacterium]
MSEITIEKTGEDAASRSLRITVPVERVQAAESKAVAFYAKRARLPGFRPGKAPAAVVKKRFDQAIKQSVLEEVVREGWEEARTSQSLKPIADPSVRNLKFEEGQPLEFEIVVAVQPEITLEKVGGFSLTRPTPVVDDAAVTEQLDKLRERKAAWLPVDGKPAPGHMVRVDVAPIEDGKVGEAAPYNLVIGQNQAIPDLEERIMTLQVGETAEADVKFPDDHPDEARRGQGRTVRITLHEVKRQELPALDDAFAREVGEFDSMQALTDAIRKDLDADAVRSADQQVRSQLVNEIVTANGVPAPESLVHRWLHAYAEMYGVPKEQLGQFEQQFHAIAEMQVKRDLVLDAVIEREGLRATEAEIDERIAQLAAGRGVSAGEYYQQVQKAGRLGEIERSISEEKAFAWLLGQSTVVEA